MHSERQKRGGTHELGEEFVDGSAVRVLGDHEQHKRGVDEAQRVVLRHLTKHADKNFVSSNFKRQSQSEAVGERRESLPERRVRR